MKKHFFITGYPRSRTCWTANLLSNNGAFCFHDALADLAALADLRLKLEQPAVPIVGLSDPALLLFWRTLVLWYPEAKWVIIERDLADSWSSAWEAFGPSHPEFFLKLRNSLTELKTELQPMVVPFEEMTPEVCRAMAAYVGVDPGPDERIEQLCATNVQVHNLKARLARTPTPQFMSALTL